MVPGDGTDAVWWSCSGTNGLPAWEPWIQPFGITGLQCFLDAADKDRNVAGFCTRFFVADGLEGCNASDDEEPFVVEIGVVRAKIPKHH